MLTEPQSPAMAMREADGTMPVLAEPLVETLPARLAPRETPLRVLLVCNLFTLPYRVMRCAGAAGASVIALGNIGSKGLAKSRYCEKFIRADHEFDGSFSLAMAEEINRYIDAHGIGMVLSGDALSTRSVIALKTSIKAPCFPSPNLEQFDFLNNKWEFTQLCMELGISCPQTWLFADKAALIQAIRNGEVPLPAIAKPLSLEGGHGVIKLSPGDAIGQAGQIYYGPVLVQEFIEGTDIGASIYADEGRITSFIAHRLKRATYSTFHSPEIRGALAAVMDKIRPTGVFNFDMRLTPEGRIFYLECNPRFFYKINLSMAAGINFVAFGLGGTASLADSVPDGTAVRMPKAFAAALVKPWTLTRRDFGMLGYFCADPVPYLRETLKIDWED